MSGLIQRIAEAIYELNPYEDSDDDGRHGPVSLVDLSEIDLGLWSLVYGQARIALTTARNPMPEMLEAARDWSLAKYGQAIGDDAAIGCWQAMIDAALKQEAGKCGR